MTRNTLYIIMPVMFDPSTNRCTYWLYDTGMSRFFSLLLLLLFFFWHDNCCILISAIYDCYYYTHSEVRWSLPRTTRMKVVVRARNQFSIYNNNDVEEYERERVNGPKRQWTTRDIGRRTHGQLRRPVWTRRMCCCLSCDRVVRINNNRVVMWSHHRRSMFSWLL